ncbi:MAG: hypothetical protein AB1553_05620 [Nitrospirota bacterium]
MSSLVKILLFTSPILAIVFYWNVSQQRALDVQMQREDAAFDRSWNELAGELSSSKALKKKYAERAREADTQLKELEAKEKVSEKRPDDFLKEFDNALEDKDVQKELERRLQ